MAELCDEEAFDAQSLSPRSPEVPYDGTPVRLKPRQAVIETSSSDSDLPRWCYDEHLATRRKKKRLGGPSPLTATGATNHQNYDDRESDLSEIKHLLTVLSSKVEQNEKTLKDMRDESISSSSSSSSSSAKKRTAKIVVPTVVRQEVRRTYRLLLEDDEENFLGFETGQGANIKSPRNQSTMKKLLLEVKAMNPSYLAGDIRDASYRFYRSKCEEDSAKRRGISETRKLSKRRHERIMRKKKDRESAVRGNSKLTEEQKKKWLTVMSNDFMSSEESEEDQIVVHPLPWCTPYVNTMFSKIDTYVTEKKSPQARRQTKSRKTGFPSTRQRPFDSDTPDWATLHVSD